MYCQPESFVQPWIVGWDFLRTFLDIATDIQDSVPPWIGTPYHLFWGLWDPGKVFPFCYLVLYRSNHLLKRFFCSKANIFFLFGGSLLKTSKWQPYVVLYRQKALKKSFATKKSPYHYDFQYKSKKNQKKIFSSKKKFFCPKLELQNGNTFPGSQRPQNK